MAGDETDGGTSPCFAHLLIDGQPVDPETARDVARFRRAERARLVAARALPSKARARATARLIAGLDRIIVAAPGVTISAYWPIRGEPDLRAWMERAHAAGARILLPVVVEKHQPIEFRAWAPGCRMTRGFWNIPVPATGAHHEPDIVIAPLVGVDDALYRLGNGGGYYDRTLARLEPSPRIIGAGFAGCRLPTIFPMPWDVPMNEVLLSDGTYLQR
ncbi:5-formyltetrahydrofolate cyclo-ligase [Pseudooceanicola aestuarii]|uniref:5-formyltetrahydrofolate cyclo-ligase n=1 Tax=Pseudooceanicola aestuarii TaxID=2697319 RepID=UPI0013D5C5E7|nr:5-formyltetrahydrofolate cyclo-ligase [Pseudooceanicola aestuarii]